MTLAQMVDHIMIDVPGCPMVTIKDAVLWAQAELCRQGNAWVETVPVEMIDGRGDVAVPGADLVRVLVCFSGGRKMRREDYSVIPPSGVTTGRDNISVYVALEPAAAGSMPEHIAHTYREGIMSGARARLLAMPQPWRDLSLADYHSREFQDAVNLAKELSWAGVQGGGVRMSIPRP